MASVEQAPNPTDDSGNADSEDEGNNDVLEKHVQKRCPS